MVISWMFWDKNELAVFKFKMSAYKIIQISNVYSYITLRNLHLSNRFSLKKNDFYDFITFVYRRLLNKDSNNVDLSRWNWYQILT